jgi:hypothetical protein
MGVLTLKPINVDDPPEGLYLQSPVRGIVIYWRPAPPDLAKALWGGGEVSCTTTTRQTTASSEPSAPAA